MKKLVCYTCCTGGYDSLIEHAVVNDEWDYVYFTDNKDLISKKKVGMWTIKPLAYTKSTLVKRSRWHKTHPHKLFPKYEYSLWIDSNISIQSNRVFKFVDKFIMEKVDIAIPEHPDRNCIYKEAGIIKERKIDEDRIVDKEINVLHKAHYPENNGLSETCIIFRQHHNKKIKKAMDEWWKMIYRYSKRDQLSFNFVMWKNNIIVTPFYKPYENHRENGDFKFIYGKNHTTDKKGHFWDIYLLGHKIFSFRMAKKKEIASTQNQQISPVDHIRSLGVKVGKNFRPIIHPHPWSYPDFGSEPWFIEIGDDVCISFGCTFLTHDAAVHVCEKLQPDKNLVLLKYGRIKIGNNCFIGCNCTILPNVTIGDNCVVGAGSVVTKSIPSGEVWAGNPAHFITTIEKFTEKSLALFYTKEQEDLRAIVFEKRKNISNN